LHVIYHAIVKALLFMCVGLVIRATKRRAIQELGGLAKVMPLAAVCTGVGALSIAGTPPFCIFDSEWMIFGGALETPYMALSVLAVFGSLLTVAYALWFWSRIFLGHLPEALGDGAALRRAERALPLAMVVPTVLLALLALIEGLLPAPVVNWVTQELPLLLGGNW
jgi:formate hydrogenlyase subunit 3/multisubunit Na+/H+ antiporter MnhD subunit